MNDLLGASKTAKRSGKNEFRGVIERGTVYAFWFEGYGRAGVYIGATPREVGIRWSEHRAAIACKTGPRHHSGKVNRMVRLLGREAVLACLKFVVVVDEYECPDCWGEERRVYLDWAKDLPTMLNGEPPNGRKPGQYGY
ncbi:hypothetical protein [Erwinia sp. S59]|uniref:hypothetical protein n=1 Tax=Erwinia sp. S59 TaxID=2769340 RepID=UPI00190AFE19|nr:hypothetical protein [Erwinia sp. S59]MBK0092796.1 hypothetical protein [Erwinia sp. S59]